MGRGSNISAFFITFGATKIHIHMAGKTKQLTLAEKQAEVNAKAEELSKKYNVKVHPILFKLTEDGEFVEGYFKEPPRSQKLRVMDAINTGALTVTSALFDAYVCREDSDPRITSEEPANDGYYIGAVSAMYNVITMAVNLVKKK